ncbi:DUF2807 domain-containing protein [Spirosoma sp. BT702]|uniref:DUF2807 domain-containing protein n=1 Tax=Spirosoma profusum TaxID=2771354 RepID=A0A927AQQ2_9BACT|nr:head GIN domain-containing protein [Spirosoma profusum]MBD2700993.1 DUF2807 domain-containing protein [Spirosoma profusum]
MKISILTFALALIGFQIASAQDEIVGNGEIVKQQRTISSFTKLNVRIGTRVRIVSGDATKAELEGESNILEHVITDVKNGELTVMLNNHKRFKQTKGVTVTIHVAKLDRAMVSTGSSIQSELPIQADQLTLVVETGSRMTATVSAKTLDLTVRDGSRATLQGNVAEADINLSGAGNLNAEKLTVARSEVKLDGASHADIHVTESLAASADGVSTLTYSGNPTVKSQEVSGLSKIRKRG